MSAARLSLVAGGGRSPPRYPIYTLAELAAMPSPAYLVDGIVEEGSLVLFYARPGEFKTFVTLGLAAAVAGAGDWMGRAVTNGTVVYVAAEGSGGLAKRAAAWEQHHGIAVDRFRVIRQPVPFTDPAEVAALVAGIRATGINPALVVVDTLARCFGGKNENATEDMNLFVAGVDAVRAAFGCCVLVVHHMPYGASKPRGSSALEGAVDTMIEGQRTGDVVTLTCKKQKDGEPFDPIRLRAVKVALDSESSLVLEPVTPDDAPAGGIDSSTGRGEAPDKAARKREVLETLDFLGEMRAGEFEDSCVGTGLSPSSFNRYLKELVADGEVERVAVGREVRYRIPGFEL